MPIAEARGLAAAQRVEESTGASALQHEHEQRHDGEQREREEEEVLVVGEVDAEPTVAGAPAAVGCHRRPSPSGRSTYSNISANARVARPR